ncbi:MAG: hypothetical protein ACOC5I_03520, partial [Gemmatimonadota bacterium]
MSELTEFHDRFRRYLQEEALPPVQEALDRYVDLLRQAVDEVPTPETLPPPAEPEPGDGDRSVVTRRHEYVREFAAAFRPDLFAAAVDARAQLFRRLDGIAEADLGLPDTVVAEYEEKPEATDELIRPGWRRRLLHVVRRPPDRVL